MYLERQGASRRRRAGLGLFVAWLSRAVQFGAKSCGNLHGSGEPRYGKSKKSPPLRVPAAFYGTRSVPTTSALTKLFLRGPRIAGAVRNAASVRQDQTEAQRGGIANGLGTYVRERLRSVLRQEYPEVGCMQLIINTFGTSLRRKGDRLLIKSPSAEHPVEISAHKVSPFQRP